MKTLNLSPETIKIVELSLTYLFYSFFVMSLFLDKTKDKFVYKIKMSTEKYNDELYQQYKDKKISPMVYKDSIRDLSSELKVARLVNMIVSPVLALPITLTLLLRFARGE